MKRDETSRLSHSIIRLFDYSIISLLAFAPLALFAGSVNFKGATINYENATTNWIGGDFVLIYENTATPGSFTLPGIAKARVLLVGGGGAGGGGTSGATNGGAGGGGGGGVLDLSDQFIPAGTYTVTVGAGGAAPASVSAATSGASGGNSSIAPLDGFIANGGGGGGANSVGLDGGCGGGGSAYKKGIRPTPHDGGSGTADQGSSGGNGDAANGAGAGGGGAALDATGVGAAASTGDPKGGDGRASDITGTSVIYGAGGGGGWNVSGKTPAEGGSDVSAESYSEGGYTKRYSRGGVETQQWAGKGKPGTGAGGGGGGSGVRAIGGSGGSGIVVVRISEALPDVLTKPVAPTPFEYDATEKTGLADNSAWTRSGDYAATTAGVFTATATLAPGFFWGTDPSDIAPVPVTWQIVKAENAITSFEITGWPAGEAPSKEPTATAKWGTPVIEYSETEDGAYSPEKPTEPGHWWARASVAEADNWKAAEQKKQFELWKSPRDIYSDYLEVSYTGHSGTSAIPDFQLLLRLDPAKCPGLDYARFGENGGDLCVADENGTPLDYEVDTWNTNGTSLVWVKIPTYTNAGGKLKLYWHLREGSSELPRNPPQSVWTNSGYVGVWHMREPSGNVTDATGHGLSAIPCGNTENSIGVSGICGTARQLASQPTGTPSTAADLRGYLQTESYDDYAVGNTFTISGWIHTKSIFVNNARIFSRKKAASDPNGWEVQISGANTGPTVTARGASNTGTAKTLADPSGRWTYLTVVYSGAQATVYNNGVSTGAFSITAATDNGLGLALGCDADGTEAWFRGSMDEVRLCKGALTADRIKADYEQLSGDVKLTYGPVTRDDLVQNAITAFDLPGWEAGKGPAVEPTATALVGTPVITYSDSEDGEYAAERPMTAGSWWAKASVEATETATAAEQKKEFLVWDPPTEGFADYVDLTYGGHAGTTALSDYPLLIRLDETRCLGFDYTRFAPDGSDLRVTDASGNPLACQVDTWNTNGTSLVWVKIPSYTNAGGTLRLHWHPREGKTLLPNDSTDVWSSFVGVWHMQEANGDVADATGHGLTATPQGNVENSIAVEGPLGTARQIADQTTTATTDSLRGYLLTPNYSSFGLGSVFSASCWVKVGSYVASSYIFSRKLQRGDANSWNVIQNAATQVQLRGANDSAATGTIVNPSTEWVHLTFVFNGKSGWIYSNGAQVGTASGFAPPTDNDFGLAFGCNPPGTGAWLRGAMDEVRLSKGVLPVDWIKADYAQAKDQLALAYGTIWQDTKWKNVITSFDIAGWQVDRSPKPEPSATAYFGEPVIDYCATRDGTYTHAKPKTAGRWWARARVEETDDYTDAEAKLEVELWDPLEKVYTDHVEVTYAGHSGTTTLTNFPLVVRLDPVRCGGLDYARFAPDGSDLRIIDENDDLLDYEIEQWNADGESILWVRLPKYTSAGGKLRFFWRAKSDVIIPPGPTATDVWPDYGGVWHMGETYTNATLTAADVSHDATANGLDAVPTTKDNGLNRMKSTAGVFGNGRINDTEAKASGKGNSLQVANTDFLGYGGVFTFSGWFALDKLQSGTVYPKLVARKSGAGDDNGWLVQAVTTTRALSWYGRNKQITASSAILTLEKYCHLALVFNGTEQTLYLDGVQKNRATTGTAAPTDNAKALAFGALSGGGEVPFTGRYDELRLTGLPRSADWVKAEYEQMTREVTYGTIWQDGLWKNYWTVDGEPSIYPTKWDEGTTPDINFGHSFAGTVNYVVVNNATGEVKTNAFPTAASVYTITFSADEADGFTPLSKVIDFQILVHSSYRTFPDSDCRTLLCNADLNSAAVITNQSYWQVRQVVYTTGSGIRKKTVTNTYDTCWLHLGTHAVASSFVNVWEGTDHLLQYIDANHSTNVLWTLSNALIGNLYLASGAYNPRQNYLPWSATSRGSSTFENRELVNEKAESSHVILRNTLDAAVYSSLFTNGVGTVYFDAVNGYNKSQSGFDAEAYQIAVYIGTNVVGRSDLVPTDENITNDFANVDWQKVPLQPLKRDGTPGFVPDQTGATTLLLGIENGGSVDNFYRVIVPFDIHVPVRFKIQREGYTSGLGSDEGAYILLDNVIVSKPAQWAQLKTLGHYDETKTGKQTLGFELAMNEPYPAITDKLYGRGVAEYHTFGGTPAADFIVAAKMWYRWRYLDQRFDPREDAPTPWRYVYLDPRNGFKAFKPLELPGLVGDVEYWYEVNLNAPFYRYVDYSGSGLGTGGYTEEISSVTNRSRGVTYPTGATNADQWFVRLRDGKSKYGLVRIFLRTKGAEGPVETIDMELLGDHIWRGYKKTLDTVAAGYEYRFEAYNPQEAGDTEWSNVTNCWYAERSPETMPVSCMYLDGTTNDWASCSGEAKTGYLMFQLDDITRSVTVVHSDYQNFRGWNDAKRGANEFVGTSSVDGKKSGTSPKMRDFEQTFKTWTPTPATDDLWQEPFVDPTCTKDGDYFKKGYAGQPLYKPFSSAKTLNGWTAGPGMYIPGAYADPAVAAGVALQMEGQGKGYLQFVDEKASSPRGLESVSFGARIGQAVDFGDFNYYDGGDKTTMNNYAFLVRMAFDRASNARFSGNASLSLVACYRPKVGCYEMRWEQLKAANYKDGQPTGYNTKNQRLSLYRWRKNALGVMEGRLLGSYTNTVFDIIKTTEGTSGTYTPAFISVEKMSDGSTRVIGGVGRGASMTPTAALTDYKSKAWFGFTYLDASADKLTAGTYGLLSANCEGVFLEPVRHATAAPLPASTTAKVDTFTRYDNKTVGFSGTVGDYTFEKDHLNVDPDESAWAIDEGRMEPYGLDTANLWGIQAKVPEQYVDIYVGTAGRTDWPDRPTARVRVRGFGTSTSMGTPYATNLYTLAECAVKLAAAGTADDPRTDVVIDNVVLRQWRGDDYGSKDTVAFQPPVNDSAYGWRTNFIFTSGWITNGAIRMSARRTRTEDVCSIRSPLMDGGGNPKRGIGLGMFAFEYRNAQENVEIELQIATNVVGTAIVDEREWTTLTNYTFRGLTPAQLANGVRSAYIGLHGVQGLMRIRLATNVVAAVQGETDPKKFGEIEVTRVLCRDEPELDDTCWWGWNLRTTDNDLEAFLPDRTLDATKIGLSLGLNNSVTDGVAKDDLVSSPEHMPFVQTPTFGSDIVGEVTFRARKYDLDEESQRAEVRVYGATDGQIREDSVWKPLHHFVISNTTYSTYAFKVPAGEGYRAFRFGVTGVPGVNEKSRGPNPTEGREPVRVLIDEVVVSQAIYPTVGFRYVMPFRSDIEGNSAITDILSRDEQPLVDDSWSVQAEIEVKQLPDELDLTTPGHEPRVRFLWHTGQMPWGYDNWRDEANEAELVRADGEKMIFRGGFQRAPKAVVDPSSGTFAVVQYMAEVAYWTVSGQCITNRLLKADWTRPDWYAPVDYNARFASWGSFSAYTILETIAPKRVWINEANVFDNRRPDFTYPADTNQYVEIAAPTLQSIEGWRLDYINYDGVTNTLCTFGQDGVSAVKTMNVTNEYAFITVQSPRTRDAKSLDVSKGEVDGTWRNFDMSGGLLDQTHPIALRLVRPSQVVEQAIVLEGTNAWASSRYADKYSATNFVNKLNASEGVGYWYYVGNEFSRRASDSLGVTNFIGAAKEDWTNTRVKTPGRVNGGQTIPEGYVIYANGAMLVVSSYVGADGHVLQTFGDVTNSTASAIGVARKGGDGTNIVYDVAKWWEIASLTTNGVAAPEYAGRRGRFTFTAGKGQSNSVTVVATARPREDVDALIEEKYKSYRAAILSWLDGGQTLRDEFENDGVIQLGEYWPYLRDPKYRGRRKLTLTEAYWLDIDPTSSNWVLHAGFANGTTMLPHEVRMQDESRPKAIRMGLYMAITNVNPESAKYGQNWSPYVLRGLRPGETSLGYSPDTSANWTSVTFKVTGDIQNGMPRRQRWVPQRWFVFGEGSFADDHTTVIDILNPYDRASAGAAIGWLDYIDCQVFYSWNIDTRLNPVTVEKLKPENRLTPNDN